MEKEKNSLGAASLRGACLAVCFLFISSLTSFILKVMTSFGFSLLKDLPNFAVYIFCTAASVLIFNSLALAFATSNKEQIEAFLEREDKDVRFLSEIKNVFKTPTLICETTITHVIIALCAILGAFPHIGGMFFEKMPMSGYFPAVVLTPVCFVLSLLSRYEAARCFYKLDRENNIEKILNPLWFIARMVIIAVLYPVAFPLAPILVYAIFSILAVIARISALLTVLGLVIAVIFLLFLIWGISVLRGISKRKRFLKRLRCAADENGYLFYDLKNPYTSFVTSKNQCTFTLELDGKIYDCLIVSTLRRATPLVFTSPTGAHFLHQLGTKEHNISLNHNIDFYHMGIGEKIVIVDPVPKKVLVCENNNSKRLYCADKIWGFTVHDADSFIGCVERKCLSKNSSFSDR